MKAKEMKMRFWNTDFTNPVMEYFNITDPLAVERSIGKNVERFTGFEDWRGKEIYEGDIIQFGNREKDSGDVYFAYGCFWITDFGVLYKLGHPKITGEIVGNQASNEWANHSYKHTMQ